MGKRRKGGEKKDRRTLIAEAVVTILGTDGARELSHRAVDRFLGMPTGPTNYYFRNKADLLMAGFEELVRHPTHATDEYNQWLLGDAFADEPCRVMADKEYRSWMYTTEESWKPIVLARYEFFLLASRNAELQEMQSSILRKSFMWTSWPLRSPGQESASRCGRTGRSAARNLYDILPCSGGPLGANSGFRVF